MNTTVDIATIALRGTSRRASRLWPVLGLPTILGSFLLATGEPDTATAACRKSQDVTWGANYYGQLNGRDCRGVRGTNYFTDIFYIYQSFDVPCFVATSTSGNIDTYLYIFDPEGRIIAQNDDANGNTTNSRVNIPWQGRNGWYGIELTSYSQRDSGSYTFRINSRDCLPNEGRGADGKAQQSSHGSAPDAFGFAPAAGTGETAR
ncbi:MAG: DVUA0089 family protein [Dehalococcoidia bacterium]